MAPPPGAIPGYYRQQGINAGDALVRRHLASDLRLP